MSKFAIFRRFNDFVKNVREFEDYWKFGMLVYRQACFHC